MSRGSLAVGTSGFDCDHWRGRVENARQLRDYVHRALQGDTAG